MSERTVEIREALQDVLQEQRRGRGAGAGPVRRGGPEGVAEAGLFEVVPGDPLTFVAVAAMVLFVAALACVIPARRATRVDAASALRGD